MYFDTSPGESRCSCFAFGNEMQRIRAKTRWIAAKSDDAEPRSPWFFQDAAIPKSMFDAAPIEQARPDLRTDRLSLNVVRRGGCWVAAK